MVNSSLRSFREDDTTIPGHPGVHINHKPFHKPQGPMKKIRKQLKSHLLLQQNTHFLPGGRAIAKITGVAARAAGRHAHRRMNSSHLMDPGRSNRIGYVGNAAVKTHR
jgi:hypothetical protein